MGKLRQNLGISVEQAGQLREKAIESLRPIQRDDLEEKPQKGTLRGIALSVNTNQFYMQGYSGVIDIKLENQSCDVFDSIKVEMSSTMLERTEHWSFHLESCKCVEKRFPVRPADAGVGYVQFRISAKQGDAVYAYWAETTPLVLPKVENAKDIQIQAENLLNLGQASEKFNIGGVIDLHIDEMIKRNKIKTAYDFMMEYSKLPANFKMLELEFDPERSKQLTDSLMVAKTAKKHVLRPDRGSLTDIASLQLQSTDKPFNIVLIAKASVTIGRARENDIVARILPRCPENDTRSRMISAVAHCQLDFKKDGVSIKDNHSANGTLIDGKSLGAKGEQITSKTKELELGGVLKLSIRCLADKRRLHSTAYEETMNESLGPMWKVAGKVGIKGLSSEATRLLLSGHTTS